MRIIAGAARGRQLKAPPGLRALDGRACPVIHYKHCLPWRRELYD